MILNTFDYLTFTNKTITITLSWKQNLKHCKNTDHKVRKKHSCLL